MLKMHAQMYTINDALSAVANASVRDVEKIIAALESESIGFACATETVEGPFEALDLAPLKDLGLNAKQLAIVRIAQGQSGRWLPTTSLLLISCVCPCLGSDSSWRGQNVLLQSPPSTTGIWLPCADLLLSLLPLASAAAAPGVAGGSGEPSTMGG